MLGLISVWGQQCYQTLFEQMLHNHSVWEKIFWEVCDKCPSVKVATGLNDYKNQLPKMKIQRVN